jgi:hypothetical protein
MTDGDIEIGGDRPEAAECQYLTGVLKHLDAQLQQTPKNDPLWQYLLAATDAIQDLVEFIRP